MNRLKLRALRSQTSTTTSGVNKALEILRQAFPETDVGTAGANTIPVSLPRKDLPTYLLPNNKVQPWELLTLKAAAYNRYPNFFNASCCFFGSLGRDISRLKPVSIVRPTVLALDLAKVMTSLGIIHSFEVGQRLDQVGDHAYLWPKGEIPESVADLQLYPKTFLKLNLR